MVGTEVPCFEVSSFLDGSFSGVIFCRWEDFKFLHDALCIDANFVQRAQSSFVIVVVTCESGCLSFEYQGLGIPRNFSEIEPVFGRDCLLPTFGFFWVTSWFVDHGWVLIVGVRAGVVPFKVDRFFNVWLTFKLAGVDIVGNHDACGEVAV